MMYAWAMIFLHMDIYLARLCKTSPFSGRGSLDLCRSSIYTKYHKQSLTAVACHADGSV